MKLKFFLACNAIALIAVASAAAAQTLLDTTQVRQWREDLAFLRAEMPARHANLYHDTPKGKFDSAFASLDARLPQLTRDQVIVELQKIAAMIQDGHSNVGPWRDSVIAFHTLPVALYWFPDGLRIRAADAAHASLIGATLRSIGKISIDSATALVRPLISRDNEMGVKQYSPLLLVMPEILHATGMTASAEGAEFEIEQNGARRKVVLKSSGLFPMLTGDPDKSWLPRNGWVDARDRASQPLWLSKGIETYWYTYLPADRSLYIQINTIQHKAGDSIPAFMKRAIATADSAGAERLILDLRLNGGGNGALNKLIFLPIIKSRYDVPGRFYVLTGRKTFSAAQMLVTELQKYSNATFVGEPSASKGNHYGDSYRIVLPNSKVTFRVSTLWHQYLDSRDKRDMIEPQIKAQLTFEDYAAGRDPVLNAALRAPIQ